MKFLYKYTSKVEEHEISALWQLLGEYLKHVTKVAKSGEYKELESSINLPLDENGVQEVSMLKKKLCSTKLKYIIVIGIGGPNLGTKAIYDALYGYFDVIDFDRHPKIIFADTSDSEYLFKLKSFISKIKAPEEIIINVISKSGLTTETIANMEILLTGNQNFQQRIVITSDKDSELYQEAQTQNIHTLTLPKNVGGRYSVFSSVGLFPLACVGVNISDLLEGAMSVREACLSTNIKENPAALSAIVSYQNYKYGYRIHDTFLFHPELESVGKWYRQLVAESLGKEGIGITPTVSVGSIDLHSMGQLYLGGPKDKFFTFVSAESHQGLTLDKIQKYTTLLDDTPFPLMLGNLKNKSADDVMAAILKGVKVAYEKASIPFVEVALENISANSLGKFLQYKMFEVMYLGKFLGVNAFDQPNVESYKAETRKFLKDIISI